MCFVLPRTLRSEPPFTSEANDQNIRILHNTEGENIFSNGERKFVGEKRKEGQMENQRLEGVVDVTLPSMKPREKSKKTGSISAELCSSPRLPHALQMHNRGTVHARACACVRDILCNSCLPDSHSHIILTKNDVT